MCLRVRGDDVERVGGHAVTRHLGEHRRTAVEGVLRRFEDQRAAALAEDETVARDIERTAGPLGVLVARGRSIRANEE